MGGSIEKITLETLPMRYNKLFPIIVFSFFLVDTVGATELRLYRGDNYNSGNYIARPGMQGGLLLSRYALYLFNQVLRQDNMISISAIERYQVADSIVTSIKQLLYPNSLMWCGFSTRGACLNTARFTRNLILDGHLSGHSFNEADLIDRDDYYDEATYNQEVLDALHNFHGSPFLSLTYNPQIALNYAVDNGALQHNSGFIFDVRADSTELISATGYMRATDEPVLDQAIEMPSIGGRAAYAVSEAEFLILGGVEVRNIYNPISAVFHNTTPMPIRDIIAEYPDIQYAEHIPNNLPLHIVNHDSLRIIVEQLLANGLHMNEQEAIINNNPLNFNMWPR